MQVRVESLQGELDRQFQRQDRLKDMCAQLCEDFPQLMDEVTRVHDIYLTEGDVDEGEAGMEEGGEGEVAAAQ